MQTVDPRVAEIALEKVRGTDFEKFCQSFFAATIGTDYVPLGGVHDGGADGLVEPGLFETTSTGRFMQASVTPDTFGKIRQTVQRLREFGRDPKVLIYATSQNVQAIDKIENDLSDTLGLRITVRDAGYFSHHINDSAATKLAFRAFLAPSVSYLAEIGSSSLVEPYSDLPARTLCVFIGQELERRRGKTELLEAVTDSLILWALEGTDPDKGIFLSKDQIEEKVLKTLPAARTFFRGVLKSRLDELTSKGSDGRKINFHRKSSGYCLPFETRKLIQEENVEDETLQLRVSEVFRQRACDSLGGPGVDDALVKRVIQVCHKAIHRTFHEQGLEISVFMERENDNGSDAEHPAIQDHVDRAMEELGVNRAQAAQVASLALTILRGTFYNSSAIEREYLRKLCRTYVLLFMLKNEPRVVEYFRAMTANFVLYVGADLIVRCLSEHMLPDADQMTKNAFSVLRASGSKLILTDKALDEVWYHLRTTHYEYRNNFQVIHNDVTPALASQISKILIRAYFYARFTALDLGQKPMDWSRYLGQFVTVADIGNQRSRDELRAYLTNAYGFVFESEKEMMSGLDPVELDELANNIFRVRGKVERDEDSEMALCRNAAATILRVYQRRSGNGELAGDNPFGYRTWWLTHQSRVRGATENLVAEKRARYMMRPDFILHFLANLPSAKQVQASYDEVFPSILGIRLGNRMDSGAFSRIIEEARTAYNDMDEPRAKVVLANATEKLQSDFNKRYEDSEYFQPLGL